MASKAKIYRDTVVAPGSKMFEAMEAGNKSLVEKLYLETDAEFRKANPNWKPYPPKGSQS